MNLFDHFTIRDLIAELSIHNYDTANITKICIASIFLYLFFSGTPSCLTLLLIQKIKHFFTFNAKKDADRNKNKDTEKEKPITKFEDMYLDKMKTMEEKEIDVEKLKNLANSFVIESTPLGNVLLHWDNNKDTFVYYSDHIIPYRFLEVIARKYVIINDCKKLYVNMEDEIKAAEKKVQDKKRQQEEKEMLQKENANKTEPKKNVFAKLKNYNRDNSIKSATVALDSKKQTANIPKNSAVNTKQPENMILKENANRYSYQGRFANFSFIKKIDHKTMDKNYNLTFAEFKKLKSNVAGNPGSPKS